MKKIKFYNLWNYASNVLVFMICLIFTYIIYIFIHIKKTPGYSVFIEFSNAQGIKLGTKVLMRGVSIGYIKNIKIDLNSILILVHINSSNIWIPKNCLVETSQIGLLSDSVVDIIPLDTINMNDVYNFNVFSSKCSSSKFLCHTSYLYGYRGLNYDDLLRAATRISQRFDDPRFFHSFYLFIQNSIHISNDLVYLLNDFASIIDIVYSTVQSFLCHLLVL